MGHGQGHDTGEDGGERRLHRRHGRLPAMRLLAVLPTLPACAGIRWGRENRGLLRGALFREFRCLVPGIAAILRPGAADRVAGRIGRRG
jgi:hypothetical protein